jgi:phosphatidylglycerophosphate synthase
MARLTWDGYASAWAGLHGGYDLRRAGPAVRGWLRLGYSIGRLLSRLGVSPAAVTTAGLALCVLVPLAARRGDGWPIVAAVLVLLAAVADTVDGAVAVIDGRATRLGFLYDSVADRLGEACWLAAFWAVGAPGWLVVACGALSWLHEYIRARAMAAGMEEIGSVTVGERPARVSVAVVGLLLAGVSGLFQREIPAGVVAVAAAVWLVLAILGLSQLLATVRRALA